MKKTALTIAGLALVAGGLAGCGGNDDGGSKDEAASSAPSQEKFCSSFTDMLKEVVTVTQANVSEKVPVVKQKASALQDVGAPAAMPADAKQGLDVFVGAIEKIDDNASMKDLQALGSDLSPAEDKQGQAFVTWAQTNCAPSGSSSPAPAQ